MVNCFTHAKPFIQKTIVPETINPEEASGPGVDVWAMGVILYTILCGAMPFTGNRKQQLQEGISNKKISVPLHLSEKAVDTITKMLIREEKQRINTAELLHHPWLFINDSEKVNVYLPSRPQVVTDPSITSINRHSEFMFEPASTIKALANGQINGPAVSAYHLLEEKRLREQAATE
ncbi:kinase-like domain-containing protein [Coemansia mojavensis]|nr:kinase-like domain-containing protein [Coemansia mojavensis]